MTTDIERQFFETFGIKPKLDNRKCKCGCKDCKNCFKAKYFYPEITDSHYLKMICLIAEKLSCFTNYDIDYKNIKEYILKEMILEKDYFDKQQVQVTFQGGVIYKLCKL